MLQHGVVVFAGVGDADQALVGGRQEQRSDRAVDGAVGDVEDAVPRCRGGQPAVQVGQSVGSGFGAARQVAGDGSAVVHFWLLPALVCGAVTSTSSPR